MSKDLVSDEEKKRLSRRKVYQLRTARRAGFNSYAAYKADRKKPIQQRKFYFHIPSREVTLEQLLEEASATRNDLCA